MDDIKDVAKAIIEPILNFAVKNSKDEEEKKDDVKNEDVDKRKLIDEVAGIMKSAGCNDEDIRTAIGKMEKIGYDKSEAGTTDNCKKVKNEDDEDKKDEKEVKNKKVKNEDKEDEEKVEDLKEDIKEDEAENCKVKNAKTDYFAKLNEIYNSNAQVKSSSAYKTREERLEDGKRF